MERIAAYTRQGERWLPRDQLYDRVLHNSDGSTTRYRIDFVGDSESYMVGRAATQSGGQAKFRQIRITVHPADRLKRQPPEAS